ncbi:MarR family winged helix-turn-helix transcriptional regulator [Leifsonia poae]|uniref:MarR family winged helix-turn-helix transcriptional regulator n=1 Tax=Leifsonia poae TaxID=110933 RepID=UPI003D67642F
MPEDIDDVGAELRRAVTRLYSRFLSERLDGEVTDAALFVLIHLDKQDRMSLTDLAEAARVTLGSMSQTVRRIEDLHYVTKTRGTEDRRKVAFTLTDAGRAAVAASRRHRRDWLNGRLAELSATERDDIARVAPFFSASPIPELEHHAPRRSPLDPPRQSIPQPPRGRDREHLPRFRARN